MKHAALVLLLLLVPVTASAQQTQMSPAAQEANALYQAGDWSAAAEAYEGLVAAEPENGLAWLRLGRALVELGRTDEALETLDRVAEIGLQTPFLHVYRARALVGAERHDEAIRALENIQPSPAVGGAATFRQQPEFAALEGMPRYDAFLQAVDAAAYPCRADETNRQFDFWIGTWDVFVGGQQAGTNRIDLILESCVLLENWTSSTGRSGKSFNWVDRSTFDEPRWRQLWVADQGNTLDYTNGVFEDGTMRFEGHTLSPQGDTVLQRLHFVNVAADTVQQIFFQSTDGGESWQTTWQGLYVRQPEGGR